MLPDNDAQVSRLASSTATSHPSSQVITHHASASLKCRQAGSTYLSKPRGLIAKIALGFVTCCMLLLWNRRVSGEPLQCNRGAKLLR